MKDKNKWASDVLSAWKSTTYQDFPCKNHREWPPEVSSNLSYSLILWFCDLWRSSWGPVPHKQGHLPGSSQSPRTMSRQLLSISMDGDSTASPGNLCQGSVTLIVKKCFRGKVLCFSLCLLPLVLSWEPLKRAWLCPLCTLPLGISKH